MNKLIIMTIVVLIGASPLLAKDHHGFKKKSNYHFYSKVGTTITVGPLIGAIVGIANKRAESINAKLLEKLILWGVFGIINGLATKTASYLLDSLDIPHSERGLGTTSWLASWIAYFIAKKDCGFSRKLGTYKNQMIL